MSQGKKYVRRESEQSRRLALILATQACVVEGGIQQATVRHIAAKAGVTPGLIRHYFPSKDELLCEAYRHTMQDMTAHSIAALDGSGGSPIERMHQFINAVLSPPVMSPRQHQLWASFTSLIRSNPAFAQIHQDSYLEFRRECSHLVADILLEQKRPCSDRHVEQMAVAVNAQLDGLWLEGCLAPELFCSGEIAQIGICSVNALLGMSAESDTDYR